MYIAQSSKEDLLQKGEHGGAVTAILQSALKTNRVDGVVVVKAKDGDRFDGIPVLITNPEELTQTAGALHSSSPNIPHFITEYLDGGRTMKLAVVGKPCDIRAIIELQKREQIHKENLILIGLNCSGTFPSAQAKEMFSIKFGVDPTQVIKEDIENGKVTIFLEDGSSKSQSLSELEEDGYGRRENCRRCEVKIPRMADLACGKWGAEEHKDSTFIEVCSEKGKALLNEALEVGFINVKEPSQSDIQNRKLSEEAEIERSRAWEAEDYQPILEMDQLQRLAYWIREFNKCIKCFGCRDACPLCFCDDCVLEPEKGLIQRGSVPPNALFPLTRLAHVAHSCVNCGQCQDVCPMELPLTRLFTFVNKRSREIFNYVPGMDVNQTPPLIGVTEEELEIDATYLDISSIQV